MAPGEGAGELAREKRAAVNQSGIDLDERRTVVHQAVGVGGFEHAAAADDGQSAFRGQRDEADDFDDARVQGAATEAAGFRRRADAGAGHGGVGRDDAVDAVLGDGGEDLVNLGEGEVRRDFEQQGHGARAEFAATVRRTLAHQPQQARQEFLGLEFAQFRCVRTGDVDDEIIRVLGEEVEAGEVVVGGLFEGDGLGLAEVDAEGNGAGAGRELRQALRDDLRPVVGKAEAVDEGLLLRQAEHARAGIAGLGVEGDSADFDMAEAERRSRTPDEGVLVEPGGQADGVGEL